MRLIDPNKIIGDKNVLLLRFDKNTEHAAQGSFYLTKFSDDNVCGVRGEVVIELDDENLPNEVLIPVISTKIQKL